MISGTGRLEVGVVYPLLLTLLLTLAVCKTRLRRTAACRCPDLSFRSRRMDFHALEAQGCAHPLIR